MASCSRRSGAISAVSSRRSGPCEISRILRSCNSGTKSAAKPGYKTVFVSRTEFTEKSADALYQESSKAASPIPGSTSESMFRQFNANAELSRPGHPKNSLMASPLVIGLSAIGAFLCSVLLFENVDSIASLFRRSHDVASAGMDAGAGKIDRAILQLNVVPKIKIGEQLSPQSSKDVPDKWASPNPLSPG